MFVFNPLNAELNPICHLLALLEAHHILHVSSIGVKWLIKCYGYSNWRCTLYCDILYSRQDSSLTTATSLRAGWQGVGMRFPVKNRFCVDHMQIEFGPTQHPGRWVLQGRISVMKAAELWRWFSFSCRLRMRIITIFPSPSSMELQPIAHLRPLNGLLPVSSAFGFYLQFVILRL